MKKHIEIKGIEMRIIYSYEPEQKGEYNDTEWIPEGYYVEFVFIGNTDIIELIKDTKIMDLIYEKIEE